MGSARQALPVLAMVIGNPAHAEECGDGGETEHPPQNPDECMFSKTTDCLSSDLKRVVTPCQYGGDPDCTQCGCMASVGLGALGDYKLGGVMPLRKIFDVSLAVGKGMKKIRGEAPVAARAATPTASQV